ncbi:hypothetical protein BDBG_08867 [Blastomyces gilchristii SLH14081]|uniref:Uncharacterized protein n=1 Tax=Blastomyces gilchristii (strain SLH14081) TaxID=559298 RepID=A0A179V2P7_BLAGS|nr:uncharacterized protein BDBG_08867 [Blastomyces gilchristii SLH14081]OAT13719.1 hypothetical protein BDBG_08867 [Blastomyces gilchristii SLH14081]
MPLEELSLRTNHSSSVRFLMPIQNQRRSVWISLPRMDLISTKAPQSGKRCSCCYRGERGGLDCLGDFIPGMSDAAAIVHTASIRSINIFKGPAPAPEDGPPLSASATRDLSLLWREIVAIVGAYVGTVVIFLGCLLTTGRRLRRSAQQSNRTLDMEMIKPQKPTLNTTINPATPSRLWLTPESGIDSQMWPSPKKGKSSFSMPWSNTSRSPTSPASQTGSMATFDETIVQADRMRAQDEMERLYAAVMEHDAKQSRAVYETNEDENLSPAQQQVSSSPESIQGPPEFRHLRHTALPAHPQQARLKNQPAFPPPKDPSVLQQQQHQHQQLPTSPLSPIAHRLSRLSNLSFLGSRSRDTTAGGKARRKSVRNLPISPPMGSPALTSSNYSETQPLSPRIYSPGPPPPNPSQKSLDPPSRKTPTPLNIRTGSSNSTLPFRAFASPTSATPTKTTVVERRESMLRAGGPRTGVPQTPYSPYMPFTPITPITPSHIVTRRERKQKRKENGLRVQQEEDLVMSDEDMWGT